MRSDRFQLQGNMTFFSLMPHYLFIFEVLSLRTTSFPLALVCKYLPIFLLGELGYCSCVPYAKYQAVLGRDKACYGRWFRQFFISMACGQPWQPLYLARCLRRFVPTNLGYGSPFFALAGKLLK